MGTVGGQAERAAGTERANSKAEHAETVRSIRLIDSFRSICSFTTLVYCFGSWTVGFWAALALGVGWPVALTFAALVFAGVTVVVRRQPAIVEEGSDDADQLSSILLVLGLVLIWPVLLEAGRGLLGAVAVGLVATRLLWVGIERLRGRQVVPPLVGVVAATISVASALLITVGWAPFVALVLIVALSLLVRPSWPLSLELRHGDSGGIAEPRSALLSRRWTKYAASGALLVFGVLLGVWHAGWEFWSPDNTYYLNKAINYSQRPWSFPVRDYLYGVPGVAHIPFGDSLSAFEPLIGTVSAITGLSVPRVAFGLVGLGVILMFPFAVHYAASGLRVRRPKLVAAVAAASIIMMGRSPNAGLFVQISIGKDLGRLVFLVVLLGAVARLVDAPSTRATVTTTMAAISTLGMSPSLGLAAIVIVGPFTAAAVLRSWTARNRLGTFARASFVKLLIPLGSLLAYGLLARLYEANAEQRRIFFTPFPSPSSAWLYTTTIPLDTGSLLALVLVAGSVAAFAIFLGTATLRRGGALLLLLLLGLLFSPLTFGPVLRDLLGLDFFAARILWALPVPVLIGIVVANLDRARTLQLVTLAAAVLAFGLSGTTGSLILKPAVLDVREAPGRWPWQSGIPSFLAGPSARLVEATPPGRRFLAPSTMEEVATATQNSRFPVYARDVYVLTLADSAPPEFAVEDRIRLAQGINRPAPGPSQAQWKQSLDRLDVATVCIDERTDPVLRASVESYFARGASTQLCQLWTRPGSSPP